MPIEMNEQIRNEAENIDNYLIKSTEDTVNMFKRLVNSKTPAEQCSQSISSLANRAVSNFSAMLKEPIPPKKPEPKEVEEVIEPRNDLDAMFDVIELCEHFSVDLSQEEIDPELRYKLDLAIFNIHKIAFDYVKNNQ